MRKTTVALGTCLKPLTHFRTVHDFTTGARPVDLQDWNLLWTSLSQGGPVLWRIGIKARKKDHSGPPSPI